jgi:hypothetical protein
MQHRILVARSRQRQSRRGPGAVRRPPPDWKAAPEEKATRAPRRARAARAARRQGRLGPGAAGSAQTAAADWIAEPGAAECEPEDGSDGTATEKLLMKFMRRAMGNYFSKKMAANISLAHHHSVDFSLF